MAVSKRWVGPRLQSSYIPMLTETLADRGILFIHGALAGDNSFTLSALNLVYRRAGIYGYSLINELREPGAIARGTAFVTKALAAGKLPMPVIDSSFALDDIRAAYDRMRAGGQTGRIVVTIA